MVSLNDNDTLVLLEASSDLRCLMSDSQISKDEYIVKVKNNSAIGQFDKQYISLEHLSDFIKALRNSKNGSDSDSKVIGSGRIPAKSRYNGLPYTCIQCGDYIEEDDICVQINPKHVHILHTGCVDNFIADVESVWNHSEKFIDSYL